MYLKNYIKLWIFLFAFFSPLFVYSFGTIVADFSASKTTVCLNEQVTFTDNSNFLGSCNLGTNQYSWNFGIDANPVNATTLGPHNVSWSSSGSKTVALTTSNAIDVVQCNNTETKTSLVTVIGTCNFLNTIPTLTEWGLFTLFLMMLSFSIIMIVQPQLVAIGVNSYKLTKGDTAYLIPFSEIYLKKALWLTSAIVFIYFLLSVLITGTVAASDLAGIIYAGFVFTYFVHLVWLLYNEN